MTKYVDFKKAVIHAVWFMFLTFPLMVIRVNPIEKQIFWRWNNLFYIAVGIFFLSIIWQYSMKRKEVGRKLVEEGGEAKKSLIQLGFEEPKIYIPAIIFVSIIALSFPFLFSMYQTTIMTTALMYVILGLGLNIVVGLAGLLDLGYVAFYAVGAYSYALLNLHYGLNFWICLPIGAIFAAIAGILLGFPVLRLRGDYLAIVTLGFGEIIRLVLENWNDFSKGPSGIANIPRPSFFGMEFGVVESTIYIYYLMIIFVLFTIFVVNRLQNSRIGRAWIALREDEIACQAMGIDKTKTKLTAFALGALWAGMVGVIFAAKTTFINPASFTFLESAIILSIVVLGGMGSIVGVMLGAFIMILMPEYFRAFSEYRMLLFGLILVVMMVFRPQGMISNVRRVYKFQKKK